MTCDKYAKRHWQKIRKVTENTRGIKRTVYVVIKSQREVLLNA